MAEKKDLELRVRVRNLASAELQKIQSDLSKLSKAIDPFGLTSAVRHGANLTTFFENLSQNLKQAQVDLSNFKVPDDPFGLTSVIKQQPAIDKFFGAVSQNLKQAKVDLTNFKVVDPFNLPQMNKYQEYMTQFANRIGQIFPSLGKSINSVIPLLSQLSPLFGKMAQAANSALSAIGSGLSRLWNSLTSVKGLLISFGVYIGASKLFDIAKGFLNTAASIELMKVKLNTIMRGEGNKWFDELLGLATKTPYALKDLVQEFVYLRASGLQPTVRDMQILLDTVSAVGGEEPIHAFQGIARALGQIQAKGKLAAQEVMQLVNWLVPVYDILREELGATTATDFKNMADSVIRARAAMRSMNDGLGDLRESFGLVGEAALGTTTQFSQFAAADVIPAILEGLRKRFSGMTENIVQVWAGAIHVLGTLWEVFKYKVMSAGPLEYLSTRLRGINKWIQEAYNTGQLKEWADIMGTKVLNAIKKVDEFLQNLWKNRDEILDKLIKFWETLKGIGEDASTVATALKPVWAVLKLMIDGFTMLPTWVQEIGIISAILFGSKAIVVIATISIILGLLGALKDKISEIPTDKPLFQVDDIKGQAPTPIFDAYYKLAEKLGSIDWDKLINSAIGRAGIETDKMTGSVYESTRAWAENKKAVTEQTKAYDDLIKVQEKEK